MVPESGFQLQWEDFNLRSSSLFKKLRSESDFYDVTLGCTDSKGQLLQAHKVIIASFSSVFRGMLKQDGMTSQSSNNGNNASLLLRGIPYQDLSWILDFMYQGEVKMPEDHLPSFLSVAEDLKIEGLTDSRPYIEQQSKYQVINLPNRKSSSNLFGLNPKLKEEYDYKDFKFEPNFERDIKPSFSTIENEMLKNEMRKAANRNQLSQLMEDGQISLTPEDLASLENDDFEWAESEMVKLENGSSHKNSESKPVPKPVDPNKKKRHQSIVWQFYIVNEHEKTVACSVCDQKLTRGKEGGQDYGTSGMWKHLRCNHPIEYKTAIAMKHEADNK